MEFAVLGAKPRFDHHIPIGQLYFPSWDRYEAAMRGIFDRQYYNNNGPLLDELEHKLQTFFGVKHAICVMNATFGLMMAADALKLSGKVVVPSFTFVASAQALSWAGIEPVFCDVDPSTHQIDISKLDPLIDKDVSAVLGVNLWGGACLPKQLQQFCTENGLKLFFDSAHGFGCEVDGAKVGSFGDLEVFSFHATKILNATEGGCICTNNDEIADRLRSIRPSYGRFNTTPIKRVINARMSEAQAAIALLSLNDFEKNRRNNEEVYYQYQRRLMTIPGIRLVPPTGVTLSNYQYVVCELDESIFGLSRNELIKVLLAENVIARRYFYPGVHRTVEYAASKSRLPITERLCDICLQLPVGAFVSPDAINNICDIIQCSHHYSDKLKPVVSKLADQ